MFATMDDWALTPSGQGAYRRYICFIPFLPVQKGMQKSYLPRTIHLILLVLMVK